jgi:hypothetical protein
MLEDLPREDGGLSHLSDFYTILAHAKALNHSAGWLPAHPWPRAPAKGLELRYRQLQGIKSRAP